MGNEAGNYFCEKKGSRRGMPCGGKYFQLRKMLVILQFISVYPAVSCSRPELCFPLCLEGALYAFVCYGKQ